MRTRDCKSSLQAIGSISNQLTQPDPLLVSSLLLGHKGEAIKPALIRDSGERACFGSETGAGKQPCQKS